MNLKCILGFHTNTHDSIYEFKSYSNIKDPLIIDNTVLAGHGRLTAHYDMLCGDCGKNLGHQAFYIGWYPKGMYPTLPHSLEECIDRAKSFHSDRG